MSAIPALSSPFLEKITDNLQFIQRSIVLLNNKVLKTHFLQHFLEYIFLNSSNCTSANSIVAKESIMGQSQSDALQ